MSDGTASTAGRCRPPLAPSDPSTVNPLVVWVALLVLAALAWAVTVFQAWGLTGMSGMPGISGTPPGSSPAVPFLLAWTAMMVAMMFPSVAPVVTAFANVGITRRRASKRVAPVWVFLLGYLAVWSIFGAVAHLLSLIVPDVSMTALGLRASTPIIAGSILIFAGAYQWSRMKRSCLEHCRSPLALLQQAWRGGAAGALRLGIAHGAQCVGCCGGLMLVLFAVGLMNLGWMVALATVFFVEKVTPHGPLAGRVAGALLFITGVAVL